MCQIMEKEIVLLSWLYAAVQYALLVDARVVYRGRFGFSDQYREGSSPGLDTYIALSFG